jgi:hypothetical protein
LPSRESYERAAIVRHSREGPVADLVAELLHPIVEFASGVG